MQKFLKLPKIFKILAILGLVLIVILLLKLVLFKSPAEPSPVPRATLPPPTIIGEALPQNTTLLAKPESLPKELLVYQGVRMAFSAEKAVRIAQEFGFAEQPKKSNDAVRGLFYLWPSEKNSLSISLDSPEISYSVNDLRSSASNQNSPLPNPDEASKSLADLIKKLELPLSDTGPEKTSYLGIIGGALLEAGSQDASFIRAELPSLLEGYPLVGNDPSQTATSILLGGEKEIAQFHYKLYFSRFLPVRKFPVKNASQISSALVKEGKVVRLGVSTEGVKEITFSSASLTQISLVYYRPSSPREPIQPIYVLSGEGILAGGQKTEITVYLPAFVFE